MKWWITKTSRRLIRRCKAVDWSIKIGMVFKGIRRLSSNQNMSCHLCAQVLGDNQRRWFCWGAHSKPRNHLNVLSLTYAQCIQAFLHGSGLDQWVVASFIHMQGWITRLASLDVLLEVTWAVTMQVNLPDNNVQNRTIKDRLPLCAESE